MREPTQISEKTNIFKKFLAKVLPEKTKAKSLRINLTSYFLVIAILVIIVGGIGFYSQNKVLQTSIADIIKHGERMFLNLEERDSNLLASTLEVISHDKEIKEIYLSKDREELYKFVLPLFKNLKNNHGITHWYFILPNGTNFIRIHNKEIYGDQINRDTFLKAQETKKLTSGIELGKTAFALRVVMPYYHNNQLIGYIELGQEIEHFLNILKGETTNEFALAVDKTFLDQELYIIGVADITIADPNCDNVGLWAGTNEILDSWSYDITVAESVLQSEPILPAAPDDPGLVPITEAPGKTIDVPATSTTTEITDPVPSNEYRSSQWR